MKQEERLHDITMTKRMSCSLLGIIEWNIANNRLLHKNITFTIIYARGLAIHQVRIGRLDLIIRPIPGSINSFIFLLFVVALVSSKKCLEPSLNVVYPHVSIQQHTPIRNQHS